jgi:hypothetical protein
LVVAAHTSVVPVPKNKSLPASGVFVSVRVSVADTLIVWLTVCTVPAGAASAVGALLTLMIAEAESVSPISL